MKPLAYLYKLSNSGWQLKDVTHNLINNFGASFFFKSLAEKKFPTFNRILTYVLLNFNSITILSNIF